MLPVWWVLKDLGWVLLLKPVAMLAALAAIRFDAGSLVNTWPTAPAGVRALDAAETLWLAGNSVWMFSELSFEKKDKAIFGDLPWSIEPLREGSQEAKIGAWCAGTILLTALSFFVCAMVFGLRYRNMVERHEQLVFGVFPAHLYMRLFIGPWIVKDLFWIQEAPRCALMAGSLTMLLALDCFRRFRDLECLAALLWFVGNAIWLVDELVLDDKTLKPRLVAASVLLAAACFTVASWRLAGRPGEGEEERSRLAGERRPLFAADAVRGKAAKQQGASG